MLLHTLDAAVELGRLLADLDHLPVQSRKHPYKPSTKNEDKDDGDRSEDYPGLPFCLGRGMLIFSS